MPPCAWSARTEAPCVRPSSGWSWRTSGSSACGTSSRRPTAARTGLSSFWPAATFEPKKKKNVPGPRRTAAKTQSEARIVLWHSGGRSEGDLLEIRSAPQADKSPPLHGFPPASVLPQCTLPGSCLNSSTEKLCCGRKKAQLRLNFSCFVVVYSAEMDAPWSMMWLFEDCMCTWTFNGTSCAGRTCFISGF